MLIHLYNNFHNGDLLFNEPVIRNLCTNNPEHTFVMFCTYNSFIFKDIPNLTVELSTPYDRNIFFYIINPNHIAINLHIGALHNQSNITFLQLCDLELHLENYFTAFKRILNYIKNTHNIDIKFEDFSRPLYLPHIPTANISEFLSWKQNNPTKQKLVFYYNYSPKSGQQIPFDDHDIFLINLANNFTNCTFIIPKYTEKLRDYIENRINSSTPNIISCEESFNCKEDKSCENLTKLQKILENCDYSIHFDIGACFYYYNDSYLQSNNIPIHICVNEYYPNRLGQNIPEIRNKTKTIITTCIADAYLKLQDALNE